MNQPNTRSSALRIILGIVTFGLTLFLYLFLKNSLDIFPSTNLHYSTFAIILSGPIVWAIMTWDIRHSDLEKWWRGLSSSLTYLGTVSATIYFMKVMMSLDQPERIGSGLTLAISGFTIAFILAFICSQIANSHSKTVSSLNLSAATFLPFVTFISLFAIIFVVLFALKAEYAPEPDKSDSTQSVTPHEEHQP